MTNAELTKTITRYRTVCLIHRFLYYVKADPLISDFHYDQLERKLKALVESSPELAAKEPLAYWCPVTRPGSDVPNDYPRRIQILAEDLLAHAQRTNNK